METIFRYRSQEITAPQVEFIRRLIAEHPGATRQRLSLLLCEAWGWKQDNGAPRDMVCRSLLLGLDRAGEIRLPAARTKRFNPAVRHAAKRWKTARIEVDTTPLAVPLRAIRPLEFRLVRRTPEEPLFNNLLEQYHPLQYVQPVGEHLKYTVYAGGRPVACLAWSSAPRHLGARDRFIGWSAEARRRNLRFLAYNPRYLILPGVQVRNLASRALSLCLKRLGDDWTERYGYAPVLAETFVDPRRFAGTCYRAANWQYVGQTAARPTAYPNGKVVEGPKDIYLYPLSDHWKSVLCEEPALELGSKPRTETPGDWTEEEFGRVQFFDERLKHRLLVLAADFFAQPGELIPQASHGSAAKTKAAYRFFSNPQVEMPKLLRPHIESTLERVRAHPVILAVQDTTTLTYTTHPPEGAGPINTSENSAVGLLLHDTMAFTPDGKNV